MKGVQCYELFGGIALKIHTFSFFHFLYAIVYLQQFTFVMLFLVGLIERHMNECLRMNNWRSDEMLHTGSPFVASSKGQKFSGNMHSRATASTAKANSSTPRKSPS